MFSGSPSLPKWGRILAISVVIFVALLAGGAVFGVDDRADRPDIDHRFVDEADLNTERIVVRFVPIDGSEGSHSIDALETHADRTQRPFLERYDDDPGVEVIDRFWLANAVLVSVDTGRVSRSEIEAIDGVVGTHENFAVELSAGTTEPETADSPSALDVSQVSDTTAYGVEMIDAPAVWDSFDTRGDGVTVAVLDSGVDPQRDDLTVDRWAEFDLSGDRVDSEPHDRDGHGTHVAGTVLGDDASGTAIGVAPEATLYGVKVVNDTGQGSFAQIIAGMEWATATGTVDVMQLSLGATGTFRAFREPVRNARETGTLVVAASGNDGHETSSSPGNVYETLSVGAVGENGQVPAFSSGQTLHTIDDWEWDDPESVGWPETYVVPTVSAPGVQVASAQAGSATALSRSSGTSMAAPHVSGVAALAIAAVDGDVTDEELFEAIRETSVHPLGADEPDDRYGHGIVDALGTVEAVTETAANRPRFAVDIVGTNSPVRAGAVLEIDARIENVGATRGTQEVGLDIDGIGPIDTRTLTLDPDETETITLRWHTGTATAGEYTATVSSEDGYDSQTVTVESIEPAHFEVTIEEFDDHVRAGERVSVTATIENTGHVGGMQEVTLDVADRDVVDTAVLMLDPDESETITLAWDTEPEDAGEHVLSVRTADDEETATVVVDATDGGPDRWFALAILVIVGAALIVVAFGRRHRRT